MVTLAQLEKIISSWKTDKNTATDSQRKILEAVLEDNQKGACASMYKLIQKTGFGSSDVRRIVEELCNIGYVRQQCGLSYELWHRGRLVFESEYDIKSRIVSKIDFLEKNSKGFDWIYLTGIAMECGLGRHSITRHYLKALDAQEVVDYRFNIEDKVRMTAKEGAKLTTLGKSIAEYLNSPFKMKLK